MSRWRHSTRSIHKTSARIVLLQVAPEPRLTLPQKGALAMCARLHHVRGFESNDNVHNVSGYARHVRAYSVTHGPV